MRATTTLFLNLAIMTMFVTGCNSSYFSDSQFKLTSEQAEAYDAGEMYIKGETVEPSTGSIVYRDVLMKRNLFAPDRRVRILNTRRVYWFTDSYMERVMKGFTGRETE